MSQEVVLFKSKQIRRHWDEAQEKWYFSVVDVVSVLSQSVDGRKYRNKLKQRLKEEGNESVTICHQLKLLASDGKKYKTDVADTESMLRIIQSIPSPNAEPLKRWLAKIGSERIQEMNDPELAIKRALVTYMEKGYPEDRINQRLKTIEVRKELTDEWRRVGIKKGTDYAMLTNEITRAWSGMTVKEYKQHKELKQQNLRDNMSNLELVLNMLAEATTTEISKKKDPTTFDESKEIAKDGGSIAGNARKEIEEKTGESVVSKKNAKDILGLN